MTRWKLMSWNNNMITRDELPILAIALIQLIFLPLSCYQMLKKIYSQFKKKGGEKYEW